MRPPVQSLLVLSEMDRLLLELKEQLLERGLLDSERQNAIRVLTHCDQENPVSPEVLTHFSQLLGLPVERANSCSFCLWV